MYKLLKWFSGAKKVDLAELKKQYEGNLFSELIGTHVRKQSTDELRKAGMGTIMFLPRKARPFVTDFLDECNNLITYNPNLWHSDAFMVLSIITDEAKALLSKNNIKADDETLFNMFQCVVLNLAYAVSMQPNMIDYLDI